MLSLITPYLVDMDRRAIPPYQLFLKQQAQIINERYNRLRGSSGGENRATAMLRYILNFIDMELNIFNIRFRLFITHKFISFTKIKNWF